eukprot:scaffold57_cov96-Isochrysis_galbana.AAC.3
MRVVINLHSDRKCFIESRKSNHSLKRNGYPACGHLAQILRRAQGAGSSGPCTAPCTLRNFL